LITLTMTFMCSVTKNQMKLVLYTRGMLAELALSNLSSKDGFYEEVEYYEVETRFTFKSESTVGQYRSGQTETENICYHISGATHVVAPQLVL